MSETTEEKLLKLPVIGPAIRYGKRTHIPGYEELSLYDLMHTYVLGISRGTFSSRASSIAFSFFMAIFPFLLFVLNLIPYVPIENFQQEFLNFIEELLPAQTAEFFYPILLDIAANPRGSLLSFTLILSIFLMANGVNAIFTSFEFSFHTQRNRSFFRQYLTALSVSVLLTVLLFISIILLLAGQYLIMQLSKEGVLPNDVIWVSILRYLLFLIVIYITIATLYYYGTKESKKSHFFSLGSILTTFLFMVTTYLFTLYINNFSTYNELYGSIGAILIMMLYIWINSNLLLLGFELNATLYKLKTTLKD